MKKNKTNNLRLWAIGILATLLCICTAPYGWAVESIYVDCDGDTHLVNGIDIDCGEGSTHLIDTPIDGLNVWPDTTVNLDANVSQYVYVDPGGILNIYSGSVGWWIALLEDGQQYQTVTVYGNNFAVDGVDTVANQFTPVPGIGSVLTGTYGSGEPINLRFLSDIPIHLQPVESQDGIKIDIKPGSNQNIINLKSRGVVPVAVLTTDEFNAGTLDTVKFAGAKPVRTTLCDVDEDGDMDMLFHFKTQQLELNEDSTEAELTGETTDGETIAATDSVRIVPKKKK